MVAKRQREERNSNTDSEEKVGNHAKMQKETNSLIFFFVVNISMRKIILKVEYFKSMIYQILKFFKRIGCFIPR